ncbi:glycoside hydrolase family 88 protein [Pedobacter sp. MC2016-14]|uniref:glycoside hydrolase family 88 protein n=1 Tax=Pedobacter sp. MC2016-14 TaxID=2897327 RepID=UPI001E448250|nr:glycoside hydrolase family 88 protein [Pedobacter sp. MC2016-14]MCD0487570.1 glycoside hydrolase family 88 protein [Pedobacter sp. MC2016-14]
MNKKITVLSMCFCMLFIVPLYAQKSLYHNAVAQYKSMQKLIPRGQFPRSYVPKTDVFVSSGPEWWCSGFYPGTLLYLYEATKDSAMLLEAERMMKLLEGEQFDTTTHDLGFMMYCSFGNYYRMFPNSKTREILLNSAKSLASRFDPKVGCIRSWNSKPSDFIVIIDNMMNLELLFWATKMSGDSSYYKIAVTHANHTLKNHFRPDYSSYHLVNYNPETGAVKAQITAQGYADASAWARGQAWGLYGYTVMYRETKDKKYLDQARHISSYILNHHNLPKDLIPYWDFNVPDIPNAPRDASAAAVMSSAWFELAKYVEKADAEKYRKAALGIIKKLSSTDYTASNGKNGGFILKHSVGYFPEQRTEVDQPLTYADYYYLEALLRSK